MKGNTFKTNRLNTLGPVKTSLLMSLGPATALGFARFSYALLLPAMAKSLHLNYVQAGALNVTNAAGYLIGALSVNMVSSRYGHKRVFAFSMWSIALFLALVGVAKIYFLILVIRAISGYFGALIFISGGALLADHFHKTNEDRKRTSLSLGLYYGGAGVGTALSGLGIPYLLAVAGDSNWAFGWYVLAVLSLVSLIATSFALRELSNPESRSVANATEVVPTKITTIWLSTLSYGFFGAGYISFMTFIVAFFHAKGRGVVFISVFYAILGGASFISAPLWSRPLSRLKGGLGLATTYLVVSVGSILPILSSGVISSSFSGLLFGLGLMASSTAYTKIAQRNLSPSSITKALGIATAAMAFGQITGPLITGTISDKYGVALGMAVSTAILVFATLIAVLQTDTNIQSSHS